MAIRTPAGLASGGRTLWRGIVAEHPDLSPEQQVQLLEACRAKDRLDKLDELLRGEIATWAEVEVDRDGSASLVVDKALDKANATANLMKQLLAALRLPDAVAGKRPAYNAPRGPRSPQVPGGVSSLERARARKSS